MDKDADAGAAAAREKLKRESRLRQAAEGRRSLTPDGEPYVWEQFKPHNAAHQTHGAGDQASRPTNVVLALETDILANAREFLGGADLPEQLLIGAFRPAVQAWARLEARALLMWRWTEEMMPEEMGTPRKGAMKTPLELYLSAEGAAAKARKSIGLDMQSWAAIRKDLGITDRERKDALDELNARGAQIREQQKLRVIEGRAEAGEA